MTTKICKICGKKWDFKGGAVFCSDRCEEEWPQWRSRLYQVLIKPARDQLEGKTAKTLDWRIATTEFKRVQALYEEFLTTPNPGLFIQNNPELVRKMGGDNLE
jgi:hypothetical protein